MLAIFLDDATQTRPSRSGMLGPFLAVGGIAIEVDNLQLTENCINDVCRTYGFPKNEEFKWSPNRKNWMHGNLTGTKREEFYGEVIRCLMKANVLAFIIIEDQNYQPALISKKRNINHGEDLIHLTLERISWLMVKKRQKSIVIFDRPGGGRGEEDKFINGCIDAVMDDVNFIKPDAIAMLLASDSKRLRLLQCADLITSCTCARVSGENIYSPNIFKMITKFLCVEMNRIGGVGLKLHPDYRYVNLYHWLLSDTHFIKNNIGIPLPIQSRPYSENELNP